MIACIAIAAGIVAGAAVGAAWSGRKRRRQVPEPCRIELGPDPRTVPDKLRSVLLGGSAGLDMFDLSEISVAYRIAGAAARGEHSVQVPSWLMVGVVRKRLERSGFNVGPDGFMVSVSWPSANPGEEFLQKMVSGQKQLDPEARNVLEDNLWDMV